MRVPIHSLRGLHWSARISALLRQAAALAAALLGGALAAGRLHNVEAVVLAGWLAYCLVQLAAVGLLAVHLDAEGTRRRAQALDPGAAALFALVATASCASVVAVALAVDSAKGLAGWERGAHLVLAMATLAASWLAMQAMFALHYARLFYRPEPGSAEPARGLIFPGQGDPDYLDFIYFSAVVGMTSQVSDVAVASRRMRRLTLLQGLLSFAFNLVVLALAVNVVAGSLG